jgi:hypothetical protein
MDKWISLLKVFANNQNFPAAKIKPLSQPRTVQITMKKPRQHLRRGASTVKAGVDNSSIPGRGAVATSSSIY